MSEYPHTTSGYVSGGVCCSCGATWTTACHLGPPPGKSWGSDCPAALREALDAANKRADEDLGRMQHVVYDALIRGVKGALPDANLSRIDGAASDGDEFEFTEAEVSIALSMLDDALTEAREALATVTAERDELRKVAEAVRIVVPYVTATIARNNSFKTEHPDWIAIHGGRASSSEMQLESLLRAATAAMRSNDAQS